MHRVLSFALTAENREQIERRATPAYPPGMAISIEQLTENALSLPSDARALLADRLVESLDPAHDQEILTLWSIEAMRRRDEIRHGDVEPIPGTDALERVRRILVR